MITIRTYTPQDIPVLEDLMTDFQKYFVSIDPARQVAPPEFGKIKVLEMLHKVKNRNGELFVACDEGRIVGFAACVVDKRAESQQIENPLLTYGTVEELFIDEMYRGKGLGNQLLNKAEEFLKLKECKRIYLVVIEENKNAKEFYETNGYKIREYVIGKDL